MAIKNIPWIKNFKAEPKKIFEKAGKCWHCHQQIVFIFLILLAAAISLYLWYRVTYHSDWSAERKKEFMLSQEREVNFKEKEFLNVLEASEKRKENFKAEPTPIKDIFKPY